MRDPYRNMDWIAPNGFNQGDLLFYLLVAAVAAFTALAVCAICFRWFRREQRRWQKKFFKTINESGRNPDDLILTGRDAMVYGELVAQFKVNDGKQVVSVLESEGKRFIHVVGELTPIERTKMVRYLKSEGFMS